MLLLNTFLPKERKVASITFLDREQNGLSVENKTTIFDLHCKDQEGNSFVVEMQREDIGNYLERCMAYGAASYIANLDKGDLDYKSAVPVYLISFIVERSKDPRINEDNELVNKFGFAKKGGRFLHNQLINFIFVKLYEVRRMQIPDKDTLPTERFCWLLTNLPEMEKEPEAEIVGDYGAVVEAAKIAGFGKDKKLNYVTNMDKEHLERAIRHQNRIEGIAEGREEGRAAEKRENAKNLLSLGVDIETISKATGLTPEEIQSL